MKLVTICQKSFNLLGITIIEKKLLYVYFCFNIFQKKNMANSKSYMKTPALEFDNRINLHKLQICKLRQNFA